MNKRKINIVFTSFVGVMICMVRLIEIVANVMI